MEFLSESAGCTVVIGADVCPIGQNIALFRSGNADALFNDLLPEVRHASISIVNLECPLVRRSSPILKTGPIFSAEPECLSGLQNAGIKLLSLANNHILDHGPKGLQSTIEVCHAAEIRVVGAGEGLAAARRIVVLNAGRLRVGFLSMAEREFSIATEVTWGANPLDLVDFVRNVQERRADFDYLVVLVHGAHEFQPITPRIQDTCRFLIEMGANAVIVQHPHSLGGWEEYRGGYIVYGQGALIMDEAIYRDLKSFHEGFLVKLTVGPEASARMEVIPFVQSDPEPGARRMDPEREQRFRAWLRERSEKILDPAFVQAEWRTFCQQRKYGYLSALLGHNRVLRRLNQKGLLMHLLYGEQPMRGVRNLVRCETHREALETILADEL